MACLTRELRFVGLSTLFLAGLMLVACPPEPAPTGDPEPVASQPAHQPGKGDSTPVVEDTPPAAEHKGYALAIGLNKVDPDAYAKWDGELPSCERDAKVMKGIAESQGFEAKLLKTDEADRDTVLAELAAFAEKVQPGDLFVLSYSGHGGLVPDENDDEDDSYDETWCLYDGQLLDDELHGALGKFKKGVRVLVFSDSCHSGTVVKSNLPDMGKAKRKGPDSRANLLKKLSRDWKTRHRPAPPKRDMLMKFQGIRSAMDFPPKVPKPLEKQIPATKAFEVYEAHEDFYRRLGKEAPKEGEGTVSASVILISGCEDRQSSFDTGFNGAFTAALRAVWAGGEFDGDYRKFHQQIKEKVTALYPEQEPCFLTLNGKQEFEKQKPYTVAP